VSEAGIYKLECSENGKVYIGKTIKFSKRLREHRHSKRGDLLRRAIDKHGWESFNFEILETFENFDKLKDNDKLLERESYYIDLFDSTNRDIGYNVCKFSTDRTGIPLSEEHKEKVRLGNIGKKRSEETKQKMRKPKSENFKQNLRKPKSEEHKKNMSLARLGKKRKPFTEEHKEKLRQANLGKKRKPFTEEHKENMRRAKLCKKITTCVDITE
jgi:group I intron endonuclease